MRPIIAVAFHLSLLMSLIPLGPAFAQEPSGGRERWLIEEVTTEEVRRFLDPTRMINRIGYAFQMNYLPADIELMTHKVRTWIPLGN